MMKTIPCCLNALKLGNCKYPGLKTTWGFPDSRDCINRQMLWLLAKSIPRFFHQHCLNINATLITLFSIMHTILQYIMYVSKCGGRVKFINSFSRSFLKDLEIFWIVFYSTSSLFTTRLVIQTRNKHIWKQKLYKKIELAIFSNFFHLYQIIWKGSSGYFQISS